MDRDTKIIMGSLIFIVALLGLYAYVVRMETTTQRDLLESRIDLLEKTSHEIPEYFKLFMGSMEQDGQTTYFLYSHIDPERGIFIVFESADIAGVYEWALARAFFVEVPEEFYVPPELQTNRIIREVS